MSCLGFGFRLGRASEQILGRSQGPITSGLPAESGSGLRRERVGRRRRRRGRTELGAWSLEAGRVARLCWRPWCRRSSVRSPGEGGGSARGLHRGRTGRVRGGEERMLPALRPGGTVSGRSGEPGAARRGGGAGR